MSKMTKQVKAMQAALTALKSIDAAMPFPVAKFAIHHLEEALAEALAEQPAQSTAEKSELETVPANGGLLPAQQALDKMAENARELGLDYEPAQQEPYGWIGNNSGAFIKNTGQKNVTGKPLYTFPPAQRKPLGYAGITIWGGDATVTKVFTETQMKFAREPRSLIEAVVGQCLDELVAHNIKENT